MGDQCVVESDARTPDSVQSPQFDQPRLRAIVCLLLFLTVSSWLGAEAINSTPQGRVTDTTGAVIPGTTVTVLNTATGLTRSVTANADGEYQI